jgi:hypothetical protein
MAQPRQGELRGGSIPSNARRPRVVVRRRVVHVIVAIMFNMLLSYISWRHTKGHHPWGVSEVILIYGNHGFGIELLDL